MTDALVIAQIADAIVQDLLFAIAVGTLVSEAALNKPDGLAAQVSTIRLLRRIRVVAVIALIFTSCIYLYLQSAVLSGLPLADSYSALAAVITETHYGKAWLLGAAGLVLTAFFALRDSWWCAALGLVLFAASKASAGHAGGAGALNQQVWVQWLHLASVGVWAGGVMVAALVVRVMPQALSAGHLQARYNFCERLSKIALVAFTLAITMGSYRALNSIPSDSGVMLGRDYGYLLSIKITAVFAAALLGGINRTIWLPTLYEAILNSDAQRGARAGFAFNRIVAWEAAVMILILAVAAILGHTPPIDS